MRWLRIFIWIFLFFLVCCKESGRGNADKKTVAKWTNRSLNLPLNDSLIFNNSSNQIPHKKDIKILTLINGGCGTCVDELSDWKLFINKIDTSSVGVIFLVESFDGTISLDDFKNTDSAYVRLNYPYYNDIDLSIFSKYDFPHEKKYQTFLLNQKNEVVLIGNPIFSEAMEDLYLKKISQLIGE